MTDTTPQSVTLEQKQKTIRVFFWANAAAPLIYMAVCELLIRFVFKAGHPGYVGLPAATYNLLRIAAYAIAAVETILIVSVKSSLSSGSPSGAAAFFLKQKAKGSTDDMMAAQGFLILILAFCTSIAIYGLALFLLNGVRQDSYPLMILGVVLCLLFDPTKENLNKIIALRKT